jgi:hypothetical protein
MSGDNYWWMILEAIASGAIPPPGEIAIMTVLHDDWCALLSGSGPCDCDPEILTEEIDQRDES